MERAGRLLLDLPALSVGRGEVLAVIGPNGAGKSTLLRVIGLLDKPTAGQMRFDGQPALGPSVHIDPVGYRRRMALVFQEPLLLDTTVFDNVALGLWLRGGVSAQETTRRVEHWLSRFGITQLAQRQARTLSGGEAQRTSLARAFVLAPELLLLDEPFAGLDPPARSIIQTDVRQALAETGTTAILVTHDRDEALFFGHRVAVLIGGRLRQIGPTEEVFSRPADAEVAELVGVENVLAGRVVEAVSGVVTIASGDLRLAAVSDLPIGQRVLVCVRPDDITLSQSEGPATSARNQVAGLIESIRPHGAVAQVSIQSGDSRLVALVTRASLQELELEPGGPVVARFKATAIHLIVQQLAGRRQATP